MRYFLLLTSLLFWHYTTIAQPFLPDLQFGNAGMVTSPEVNATNILYNVAVQGDGKIVAVGTTYINDGSMDNHVCLIRYKPDGTLDQSFGINGHVKTFVGDKDIACALAIQPDGKIVVAGNETVFIQMWPNVELAQRPFLIRYHNSGILDSSFGTNGIHHLSLLNHFSGKYVNSVLIRPDGKIITAGSALSGQYQEVFVICLNSDGSYDNSFGTDGKAMAFIQYDEDATFYDMVLQPDGKLIVVGSSGLAQLNSPPDTRIALMRFKIDGSLDMAFGTGGKVTTQVSDSANPFDVGNKVVLQNDGKIVVAGASEKHLALLRYLTDGSPDMGFGNGGIVVNDNLPPASGLYLNAEGKLLTSGAIAHQEPYRTDILLARHSNTGVLDISFGAAGSLLIDKSDNDQAYALCGQSDQKVIVAGNTIDPVSGNTCFTLLRFAGENGETAIGETPALSYLVQVYPNPAQDILKVSFGKMPGEAVTLRLLNVTGQVIQERSISSVVTTIDTRHLSRGTYLLQLLAGRERSAFKVQLD